MRRGRHDPSPRKQAAEIIRAWAARGLCASCIGVMLCASPVSAQEFGNEELQGIVDLTLSQGAAYRIGKSDEDHLERLGANSNDGSLNYTTGKLISNTSKITAEIDLEYGDFGAFARVQGFLDFESKYGQRARRELSEVGRMLSAEGLDVLDLYVSGAFELGESLIDVRVGNQVLNWGESTFIPNGVNVVNPYDITKLRKPGAELRDGLLPVPMISVSAAATPELSVEGFYQTAWKETGIDPAGTYFSTNDFASPGGMRAFVVLPGAGVTDEGRGFGAITDAVNLDFAASPQLDCSPTSLTPPAFAGADCQPAFDPLFLSLPRAKDVHPRNGGQFGLALRYYSEELNDTEFGFYVVNYHSRLPYVSGRYGTPAGYSKGLAAAGAIAAPGSRTRIAAVTPEVAKSIAAKVGARIPPGTPNRDVLIQAEVANQLNTPAVVAQIAQLAALGPAPKPIADLAKLVGIDRYARSARYFVEYPEQLQVYGMSFNTQLGASGWALQGEYSLRPNTPLQRTSTSLFTEGLAPFVLALDPSPQSQAKAQALRALLGTKLQGFIKRNVSQFQVTATKVFGPALGADSLAFVGEAAMMHVHNMPDQGNVLLRLDTPGTDGDVADATSMGYRLLAKLDYNNAIGSTRLSPYAQFQHDVSGSSPGPGGPFAEGRTALTLGLGLSYLDRVRGNVNYTTYGGNANHLSDRDYVAVSVTYAF